MSAISSYLGADSGIFNVDEFGTISLLPDPESGSKLEEAMVTMRAAARVAGDSDPRIRSTSWINHQEKRVEVELVVKVAGSYEMAWTAAGGFVVRERR